ncbi:class I SAM-dependent methyltransferase [soil metagenome]
MTILEANTGHSVEPNQSARKVAILRAVHQLLDEPVIFADPVALAILGPELEAGIRSNPFLYNDPLMRGLRAALVARSMAAEDELARAVQAGVRQYVVLGAGLDTFAFRNPHADVGLRVFEVDHLSTQNWKKATLQQAAIEVPDALTFTAVDFECDELAECLSATGFRCDQPACFSWLGVTMYLSTEAIFDTLKFIAAMPVGSSLTFDYRLDPSLLNVIECLIGDYIQALVAQHGEPWKSAFIPALLQQDLRNMGFSQADSAGSEQLNARYFHERKDGLRIGNGFQLMCARI